MIFPEEHRPLRLPSDELIVEELPDELMIYDPARNKAFCLNQTAAFVWNHCDGTKTIAELAKLMRQRMGKAGNKEVVRYALDALAKDGLLAPSTILPASGSAVTRRNLMRKLGAGAAAALPLIIVLIVSPANAHASSIEAAAILGKADGNGFDLLRG